MWRKAFFSTELFMFRTLAQDEPETIFAAEFEKINNTKFNPLPLFDDFQKTFSILSGYIKHFHQVFIELPAQETEYFLDEDGTLQEVVLTDKSEILKNRESDHLFGPALEIFQVGYVEGLVAWHYKNLNLVLDHFLRARYAIPSKDKDFPERVAAIRKALKQTEKCSDKNIYKLFSKDLKLDHLQLLKVTAGAVTHGVDNALRPKHLAEDRKLFTRCAGVVPGVSLDEQEHISVGVEYLDFLEQINSLVLGGIARVLERSSRDTWQAGAGFFEPGKLEYRQKLFRELFVLVFNKQLEKILIAYHKDNIEDKVNILKFKQYALLLDRDPLIRKKPALYKSLKYIIDSFSSVGRDTAKLNEYLELMEVYAIIRNTLAHDLNNEIPLQRKDDLDLLKSFSAKYDKQLISGDRKIELSKQNIQFLIKQFAEFKEVLARY